MSCLRIPSLPSLSSPLKRKTRKTGHDAHEFKYFMDGNPTSTSTFELGSDTDSFNNENISPDNLSLDESILASSQQNSSVNFPLSAPSSIARNKIQACSTPKDEVKEQEEPKPTHVTLGYTEPPYSPAWRPQCQDRRNIYRHGGIRNMARATPPRPGCENIKNSYFTRENRPILEEMHRKRSLQEFEERLEQQRLDARRENFALLRENGFEFLMSFFVTVWQLLFMINVIPNDHLFFYCANIVVCLCYGVVFMAPHPILWAIVACSFAVYISFAWLFGTTFAYGLFIFVAVFAKSTVTLLQAMVLLAS